MISHEDQAELLRLEHAMWSGATRYDPLFQERHFAEDFFEFGRSGRTYSRSQCIVTDGPAINARLMQLRVRPFTCDLVQITYDSIVTGASSSTEHAHRSSIWSRHEGSWIMRFHQGTPYVPIA